MANNTKKTEEKQIVQVDFAPETVDLIKRTIAVDATDDELKMFLYQAKRTGLDPLARQIFFIKRGNKVNIQTSIDGLRIVAERHGDYAGQDEPEFEEKLGAKYPDVAKVRVYKWHGTERYLAAIGVAYWNEYKPVSGQDFMWQKMPHTMLAKVAEALALRKAFPQDLSGIYSDDEMAQVQEAKIIKPVDDSREKAKVIVEIEKLLDKKGKDKQPILEVCKTDTLEECNLKTLKNAVIKLKTLPDADPAEVVDPDEADKAINENKEKEEEKCEICGDLNGYHKKACPNNKKEA